jgi:transcription elongation factor GreA
MSRDQTPPAVEPMRLGAAASTYLTALSAAEREAQGVALSRFVRWLGPDKELSAILPIDLERYQEQLGEVGVDPYRSLEAVRAFFADVRKRHWTQTNLGVHIKLRRRPTAKASAPGATAQPAQPRVEISPAGLEALQRELQQLESEVRPQLSEALQIARADGDMRENAPYDAAKQRLAEVQTRINTIRSTIAAATIVESVASDRAGLGTRVVLRDLDEDEELTYTLVGPGEIDARRGRISVQSPVGRALVDRAPRDVVEVQTPAGTVRYRNERLEANKRGRRATARPRPDRRRRPDRGRCRASRSPPPSPVRRCLRAARRLRRLRRAGRGGRRP